MSKSVKRMKNNNNMSYGETLIPLSKFPTSRLTTGKRVCSEIWRWCGWSRLKTITEKKKLGWKPEKNNVLWGHYNIVIIGVPSQGGVIRLNIQLWKMRKKNRVINETIITCAERTSDKIELRHEIYPNSNGREHHETEWNNYSENEEEGNTYM